ncbi:MAG TPA: GNAT family N-acetyltransferase [Woeseiaceae bacterium]|nr:GNAT family N-acetyltransferase [Woeseiaceae bacterium]
MKYRLPELLARHHDLDGFVCSSEEQTEWLLRYARQSMTSGATKVFVVTPTESSEVVAYYAWTMAQIDAASAPKRLIKGAGRYPQPVALLARLGVHHSHERKGLGAGLLQHVVRRVAAISDEIGCRGLLVHAESDRARAFYQHLIPEFEQCPTDELHLVLLLKDIKRTLQS